MVGFKMSSPIYIPDKKLKECANCKIDCSIEASGRSKYMEPRPFPKCGCPFGVHDEKVRWIQWVTTTTKNPKK